MLSAQAPAPAKGKSVQTFEKFFKEGMKKVDGVLPVYIDNGKYYLEISESILGRDILASGAIAEGPWCAIPSHMTDVFQFTKTRDNELNYMKIISSDVIDEERGDEGISEAIKNSTLQPVTAKFPIVAHTKDKKGYIIDITKDITMNGALFAMPNLQWVNRPDASRSFIVDAVATEKGVKFINCRTQTEYMPSLMGMTLGYFKNITVNMEWALQLLPEAKMSVRIADPRVGYLSQSYNDYGVLPTSVQKTTIIKKWNLQPSDVAKYKSGELVNPKSPIVLHLDKTIPPSDYTAIELAVADWNRCFETAGFKNAIVIEKQSDKMFFEHGGIKLSCSNSVGKPSVATVSDPRTGEILSGTIHYGAKMFYEKAVDDVMLFTIFNPKMKTDNSLEEIRAEIMRSKLSNSIGLALGLKPNQAGSYAYTSDQLRDAKWLKENGTSASIMDECITNYIIQPTDKQIAVEDLYAHTSHYDKWAIEWAYRVFPDNTDERQDKKSLAGVLARAKDNPFLLYVPAGKDDYRAISEDFGRDRVKVAELAINNFKVLFPKAIEVIKKLNEGEKDKETYDYMKSISRMNSLYSYYSRAVSNSIGGYMITPVIRDYNDKALAFVSKKEQQDAMNYFTKYVIPEPASWMYIKEMEEATGVTPKTTTSSVASTYEFHCLDPKTLVSLLEAEKKMGSKAFTTNDLFKTLENQIFFNFDTNKKVNSYYRNLQYAFMGAYSSLIKGIDFNKQNDDLKTIILANYRNLYSKVKGMSTAHSDVTSRNHFKGILVTMDRELSPNAPKEAGVSTKK